MYVNEAVEDKSSKLQYKLVDWKDPYDGSIHPAASDLWDGSLVWRWMSQQGIWDRFEKSIKWTRLPGPSAPSDACVVRLPKHGLTHK